MVKNFTQNENESYTNEVDEIISKVEEIAFETKIKEEIRNLVIEPNLSVIDRILQHSKSLSKK